MHTYTLAECLETVKGYSEPEYIDFRAECAKQFPSDLFLMDDCHCDKELEYMWAVIVSLNQIPEWRYAR